MASTKRCVEPAYLLRLESPGGGEKYPAEHVPEDVLRSGYLVE